MVVTRHQLRDPIRQPEGRVGTGCEFTRPRWSTPDARIYAADAHCEQPVSKIREGTCGRQFLTGLVCQAIGRVPVRNSGSGQVPSGPVQFDLGLSAAASFFDRDAHRRMCRVVRGGIVAVHRLCLQGDCCMSRDNPRAVVSHFEPKHGSSGP